MLLLAYLINGEPVGTVVPSWSTDDLNGNKPFVESESVISGYGDISSIENWDRFGGNCTNYEMVRYYIQVLVITIAGGDFANWNNLTLAEKEVACKYVTAPYGLRVPAVVSDEQDKENWKHLLIATKNDRNNCGEQMRLAVGEYIRTGLLTLSQTQAFFKDVSEFLYWFTEANVPDFKNWIFGLSPYEGVFESKDYYSEELQQNLIDIYNGDI